MATFSLAGFGCSWTNGGAQDAITKPVVLQWWRSEGSLADFNKIIAQYKQIHPNVSIKYQTIRPEEYESKVKEALLAQRGPDIISLPNNSLPGWQEILAPLPPTITLPFIEMQGMIKKEPVAVMKTNTTMNLRTLNERFVSVVANDAVIKEKIYGLPLHLDTLLLVYNKDLLNGAEIPTPPITWTDFKNASIKITKLDKQGQILQSGSALGEADSVPYAADILSALMLQNGTPMTDAQGTRTTFSNSVKSGEQKYTPGADALRFYTDFANPAKETFSWSREESSAWQAFASGKTAFTFAYWRDIPSLKLLAPKISLGISTFPQIDNSSKPSYFANYPLEAVIKSTKYPNEAWDFIQFITKNESVATYLKTSKQPTANSSLVNSQVDDFDLAIPAKQILNAKSWYHGYNQKLANNAFLSMIRQVNAGGDLEAALEFGAAQVDQTLTPPKK